MGDLSVSGSSFSPDLSKLKEAESTGSPETESSIFPFPSPEASPSPTPVNKPILAPSQTPSKTSSASEIPAFAKVQVPEGEAPQKEINGIKIYGTGSKEKVTTTFSGGQVIISLGENGQKISIPAGQNQPKGATVVYNNGTLSVQGLKNAVIKGRKDQEYHDTSVNNQILGENCTGCTFDMNDKVNGWTDRRDDLVMKNCKAAKVISGQNNAVVALDGTTSEITYAPIDADKSKSNPLQRWTAKYHTNIAYDDSSALSIKDAGVVNRDIHDPLIYDMVKTEGATVESNSYQMKNGSSGSATDFLLNVINEDSTDSNNGSKSMFNEKLGSKAPKLSTKEFVAQFRHIKDNSTKALD